MIPGRIRPSSDWTGTSIMSYLDRLVSCRPEALAALRPFRVDGVVVGYLAPELARALADHSGVFVGSDSGVDLAPSLEGVERRTREVEAVLRRLYEQGVLDDWRDERFPVGTSFAAPPLLHLDRGAVPRFGVRAYGVHVNGIVRHGTELSMWVGRRSATKKLSPNKLDQIVAGGQQVGFGLRENLVKEAAEEADIPAKLAAGAVSVSAISYCVPRPEGLRRDVLFNYDLELPADFVPRNTDGEISEFHLWPMERVMDVVRDTTEFKFNCSLVIIDFLIRHGYIECDHPDYEALVGGLHG